MAGTLRRDHDYVNIRRRHDLLEMDVEAVRESKHVARLEVGLDHFFIDIRLLLVRNEHHDDIARRGSLGRRHNGQAGSLRLCFVLGARAQADDDVHAGIMQVLGMGMTLGAKADDGNGLAVKQGQVAVRIIIHLYHFCFLLSLYKMNQENELILRLRRI